MPKTRVLDISQIMYLHFLTREASKLRSLNEAVKEVGVAVDVSTALRNIEWLNKQLDKLNPKFDPEIVKQYEEFKKGMAEGGVKSLYTKKKLPDGRIEYESIYPTVRSYIVNARAKGLKKYPSVLEDAQKAFQFLRFKNPSNWTKVDVNTYLSSLKSHNMKYRSTVSIRAIAPHFQTGIDEVETTPYKITEVKRYELFTEEILRALNDERLTFYERTMLKAHLTFGCREGSRITEGEARGGILGIRWDKMSIENKNVDIYESKVKKGIWWKYCPIDLFWDSLIDDILKLKEYHERLEYKYVRNSEGHKYNITSVVEIKPNAEFVFDIPYGAYCLLVNKFEGICKELFPTKRFDEITPHTMRHLHVNLLWQSAEVSLELIAGDGDAGIGLMGVGWIDVDTLKRYYLTFSIAKVNKIKGDVKAFFKQRGAS